MRLTPVSLLRLTLWLAWSVAGLDARWYEAMIPAGAQTVSGVDLDRVRAAPSGQLVLTLAMPAPFRFPGPQELDAWRDLQEVIVCSGGPDGRVVLLRGGVRPQHAAALTGMKGATEQRSYRGHPVAVAVPEEGQGDVLWSAVLGGTAAVGPPVAIRVLIDRVSALQPVSVLPLALRNQIAALRQEGAAWYWTSRSEALWRYFPGIA